MAQPRASEEKAKSRGGGIGEGEGFHSCAWRAEDTLIANYCDRRSARVIGLLPSGKSETFQRFQSPKEIKVARSLTLSLRVVVRLA